MISAQFFAFQSVGCYNTDHQAENKIVNIDISLLFQKNIQWTVVIQQGHPCTVQAGTIYAGVSSFARRSNTSEDLIELPHVLQATIMRMSAHLSFHFPQTSGIASRSLQTR